jgi:hypothetical protein
MRYVSTHHISSMSCARTAHITQHGSKGERVPRETPNPGPFWCTGAWKHTQHTTRIPNPCCYCSGSDLSRMSMSRSPHTQGTPALLAASIRLEDHSGAATICCYCSTMLSLPATRPAPPLSSPALLVVRGRLSERCLRHCRTAHTQPSDRGGCSPPHQAPHPQGSTCHRPHDSSP